MEIRSESALASEAALSWWTFSKMSSVSEIFFGFGFEDSTHFVTQTIEHAANRAQMRKLLGGVVLFHDQHFPHGFGSQSGVFEKSLKFGVCLRIGFDQLDNILGQLGIASSVFGLQSRG